MKYRLPKGVVAVRVAELRQTEKFSEPRVEWLIAKIKREGVWSNPVGLDDKHNLVLDGHHRVEAARRLKFGWIPAMRFEYAKVKLYSRRKRYKVTWRMVVAKALAGEVYPYKTTRHVFPVELPVLEIPISKLRR